MIRSAFCSPDCAARATAIFASPAKVRAASAASLARSNTARASAPARCAGTSNRFCGGVTVAGGWIGAAEGGGMAVGAAGGIGGAAASIDAGVARGRKPIKKSRTGAW